MPTCVFQQRLGRVGPVDDLHEVVEDHLHVGLHLCPWGTGQSEPRTAQTSHADLSMPVYMRTPAPAEGTGNIRQPVPGSGSVASQSQTQAFRTPEASLESQLQHQGETTLPRFPVGVGGEEGSRQSLPTNPCGPFSRLHGGGGVAKSPVTTGLLSCLFRETNHGRPSSHFAVSLRKPLREVFLPDQPRQSSRSTGALSRGPVGQPGACPPQGTGPG